MDNLLSPEEFSARLHAVGEARYHHRHPFHLAMHEGELTKVQMQAWALNRYYYQSIIPTKDAIILSRAPDAEFRRAWIKRVKDHDGDGTGPGGIEKWIQLAEATGLEREVVVSEKMVLPAVRFAVDAYINLVSKASFLEAVASSLTELFSTRLISVRVKHLNELYPWMAHGLTYFQARLTQAPEDAAFALAYVIKHARTREEQELCIRALQTKCDILWSQLDAITHAYVSPGLPPAGPYAPPFSSLTAKAPVLSRGCRMNGGDLMIPEGMMKLSPGGVRVLALCDGQRDVGAILQALKAEHDAALGERIENETLTFLSRLVEKRVVSLQ